MRPHLAAASLLLVLATSASAQNYQWTQARPATSPLGRRMHAMVYDAARNVTILFGGYRDAYLGDMWAYDGSNWRELRPATLPTPRARAAMAYDALRDRIVLIGGTDGTTLTDVWEWDGTNWIRVATGQTQLQPGGSAAYDPALGGVLCNLDTVNLIWNGTSWRAPAVGQPLGGDGHVLVYDPTSGGIMMQSGQYTRRFASGGGWQQVLVSFGWSIRGYAMAGEPSRGQLALVGGRSSQGGFGTFIWTGSGWIFAHQYNVGPGSSEYAAMVFDLRRRRFVHFGGENGTAGYSAATWEFADTSGPPASYTEFGIGCSGSTSYRPALHADPLLGPRPVLGGSLMLRLEGLAPAQPVLGCLGGSRTAWGAVPLPVDLGPFRHGRLLPVRRARPRARARRVLGDRHRVVADADPERPRPGRPDVLPAGTRRRAWCELPRPAVDERGRGHDRYAMTDRGWQPAAEVAVRS